MQYNAKYNTYKSLQLELNKARSNKETAKITPTKVMRNELQVKHELLDYLNEFLQTILFIAPFILLYQHNLN